MDPELQGIAMATIEQVGHVLACISQVGVFVNSEDLARFGETCTQSVYSKLSMVPEIGEVCLLTGGDTLPQGRGIR